MDAQMKKGLLEACVLSAIRDEESYGYKIISELEPYIKISESTLYPVLRRLQKEGYLFVYDRECGGRNRRYYQITDTGEEKLSEYRREWEEYSANITAIFS